MLIGKNVMKESLAFDLHECKPDSALEYQKDDYEFNCFLFDRFKKNVPGIQPDRTRVLKSIEWGRSGNFFQSLLHCSGNSLTFPVQPTDFAEENR